MAKTAARDPHEVLGVGRGAGAAELKAAYRRAALERHPDAGGDAEAFVELLEAYSALSGARGAPGAGGRGRRARAGARDADPLPWDEMLDGLGGWPDEPSFARDGRAGPTYVTLRVTAEEARAGFRKRVTASVPGRPAKVRVEVDGAPGAGAGWEAAFPGMGSPGERGSGDLVVRVRLSRRGRAGGPGGV